MVARGRVHNGVVVLDAGVRLPEGQEVTVLAAGGVVSGEGAKGAMQQDRKSGSEIAGLGPLASTTAPSHGILDIPPLSLGPLLRPFTHQDDLLGEMLENRP